MKIDSLFSDSIKPIKSVRSECGRMNFGPDEIIMQLHSIYLINLTILQLFLHLIKLISWPMRSRLSITIYFNQIRMNSLYCNPRLFFQALRFLFMYSIH